MIVSVLSLIVSVLSKNLITPKNIKKMHIKYGFVILQGTLYSVKCTLYNVQCKVYTKVCIHKLHKAYMLLILHTIEYLHSVSPHIERYFPRLFGITLK